MTHEIFTAEEYPEGCVCADCHRAFVEGQPIAERPYAMDHMADGEPLICVEVLCVSCSIGDTGGENIVPLPHDIQGRLADSGEAGS